MILTANEIARAKTLLASIEKERLRELILEILPQGHGGDLNADLLDDLHASEIIAAARGLGAVGGGGGGGHDRLHALDSVLDHSGILPGTMGGLQKVLSPTWTNDFIPIYKSATDRWEMEAKPTGGGIHGNELHEPDMLPVTGGTMLGDIILSDEMLASIYPDTEGVCAIGKSPNQRPIIHALSVNTPTLNAPSLQNRLKVSDSAFNETDRHFVPTTDGNINLGSATPARRFYNIHFSNLLVGDVMRSLMTSEGIMWRTFFETVDGYTKANVTLYDQYIALESSANGVSAYIYKRPSYPVTNFDWAKKRMIKTRFYLTANTQQEIWLITGNTGVLRHVGLKIINNQPYATAADGTGETATPFGFTLVPYTQYLLTVDFLPSEGLVRVFIGGLYIEITTNLPTGTGTESTMMINAQLKPTENVYKGMCLSEWLFYQGTT